MEETACVLVCVTVQKECDRLIAVGREVAQHENLPLHVIHVSTGKNKTMLGNPDAAEALNYLFSLAHESDAEMNILHDSDVAQSIAQYARNNGAKKVILGAGKDSGGIVKTLEMLLPNCTLMICPA